MAPSATQEVELPITTAKVGVSIETTTPETHVHGGEGKTPLEAISHGPLIQPGKEKSLI